jgi:hypothetical protein
MRLKDNVWNTETLSRMYAKLSVEGTGSLQFLARKSRCEISATNRVQRADTTIVSVEERGCGTEIACKVMCSRELLLFYP